MYMHGPADTTIAIATLYLRAAGLHFRLSAFFNSPTSEEYTSDLLSLWLATTAFLECALNLETQVGKILIYSTNYILQMVIAGAFALLKLMNSFFASRIKFEYGKKLFTDTISAIRMISVKTNDLPSRLAEVLAQLWRSSGASSRKAEDRAENSDSSLQLKVKCRMSMSLVYDSVWRWREEFQAQGRGNLDCTLPLHFSPIPCLPHPSLLPSTNTYHCSGRQKPHQSRLSSRKFRNLSRRPPQYGALDLVTRHDYAATRRFRRRIQLRSLRPVELDVGWPGGVPLQQSRANARFGRAGRLRELMILFSLMGTSDDLGIVISSDALFLLCLYKR